MQSQNENSDLGACSQVAVFVFDYILCVQRTHSTAVNEINVERPLRHIYELGAGLVTYGAVKSTQKGLPALDADASYNCGFSKGKWRSASHHDGAAFTLPSMALTG